MKATNKFPFSSGNNSNIPFPIAPIKGKSSRIALANNRKKKAPPASSDDDAPDTLPLSRFHTRTAPKPMRMKKNMLPIVSLTYKESGVSS